MIAGFDTFSLFGWVGVFFIVLSYILYATKRLRIDYVLYHLLNLFGTIGLIVSTFTTQSWPALTLALSFFVISIVYIVKILKVKPKYRELGN